MDEDILTTGRSLVGFATEDEFAEQHFQSLVGFLRTKFVEPLPPPLPDHLLELIDNKHRYYAEYRFAIVAYPPEQVRQADLEELGIVFVEPERVVRTNAPALLGVKVVTVQPMTPGLKDTGVDLSSFSGENIRIAVLDTGFDFSHLDFPANRFEDKETFVPEPVNDPTNGHGTHTTGTACGPLTSQGAGTRYGIAYESKILVARVLNVAGMGVDRSVLEGMMWVETKKVDVALMCFGTPVKKGMPFSQCYERVAKRMAVRTVVIASAGNSGNSKKTVPVEHPANCPSIGAVASVKGNFDRSAFSCGTVNAGGGEADIAGPGEGVLSSVPGSTYVAAEGTSMAAAHVAGITALWAEKLPAQHGTALWTTVIGGAAPKASIPKAFSGVLVTAPK
jgi:subtilisin family serine protease